MSRTASVVGLYGAIAIQREWCAECGAMAACHVCNAQKGDRMFQTMEMAQAEIRLRRESRGYTF